MSGFRAGSKFHSHKINQPLTMLKIASHKKRLIGSSGQAEKFPTRCSLKRVQSGFLNRPNFPGRISVPFSLRIWCLSPDFVIPCSDFPNMGALFGDTLRALSRTRVSTRCLQTFAYSDMWEPHACWSAF